MDCKEYECSIIAEVGDCVNVTTKLSGTVSSTLPWTMPSCNPERGMCVTTGWASETVWIWGTLKEVPFYASALFSWRLYKFKWNFLSKPDVAKIVEKEETAEEAEDREVVSLIDKKSEDEMPTTDLSEVDDELTPEMDVTQAVLVKNTKTRSVRAAWKLVHTSSTKIMKLSMSALTLATLGFSLVH